MKESLEQPSIISAESKEAEKKYSNLTVYLMRHGESESDKTKPTRGLTEKGKAEVRENFNVLIDQIIHDELPGFKDFDDPEKRKQAALKALSRVELHLADSQTDRTMEQVMLERQIVTELGIKPEELYLSKPTYEWAQKQGMIDKVPEGAGPGIKKRLDGVRGLQDHTDFRKKLDSPEYQQQLGTQDSLIAWALTSEDKIPEGVENRSQMEKRLQSDLSKVERIANHEKLQNYPKRVIYVANSHASIITLGASSKLGIPMKELGEVENAEGLRFDFYGQEKPYSTEPFGEKLNKKLAQLKQE